MISSAIVVLFTSALFLSGYVVQQKTLNKLRAAVSQQMAPRPSPKIYLPDRFKQETTELEDGTIIALEEEEDGIIEKDDVVIIEVHPTMQDDRAQKPLPASDDDDDNEPAGEPMDKIEEDAKRAGEEQPISRAERRRRIKAEIQRLSQGDEPVYYQRRLW
ncbi:hypothetical protein UCREL1_3314 [Eutypa lata UCREL1]|uniref:Uncharacterized protein n=1 Tax=Eutypa lata (strain UCR-EL1) TaxID=1287681 RepID=M7TI97_EUTLA|nr:hypothetical protein UCREL1_3314 [Eutypa lata UCREL1]